ncbi:transglutaminase family protein [Flavobacterium sp.]|jgi:hypothetical protein|uniref:transglutaminase family protein n=1 Tax=Flavobacterium sp. TaxID=239 RepID=UPI0037BEFC4B
MKFATTTLFFLILTSNCWSQKNIDPTATDIELAKTIRSKYDKSDVAILESNENIVFGFNKSTSNVTVNLSVNEVLMNINQRADIYKYEFYDSTSNIEIFALKYRNDKATYFRVTDEFYNDRDLFYNDARVKHMKIDFPVQGYSYNYTLDKKFEDVKYFTSIYFNDEFPVIAKKIMISVPEWLDLELKEMNFEGHTIIKSKTVDAKTKMTVYKYEFNDVDPVFTEENSPGRTYLYPHILVLAKSYEFEGKKTNLFNSTADLYKWYKSLVDDMKDDPEQLKEKVKDLMATAKTDEEKIKNIYYWVQDNIRYIAFEDGIAGFKPDDSQNVFNKRYGDCKGMANLIKQMLLLAGFDARLTWIGTKHIAYDYSIASLSVDNHMICTVFYQDKAIFLDGTEKFNSFGEYAERIQNKEVMIEDGENYIIKTVPASPALENKETFTANLKVVGEKLTGACHRSFTGESRSQFQNIYNSFESSKKAEALEGFLSRSDKNNHISAIKTSDLKSRDQKLTIDYMLDSSNRVSMFDDEMYINFEFMNEYKGLTFKDRKTDYEFDYKTLYETEIAIVIPEGFKIEKKPDNLKIDEEDYTIDANFTVKGNTIVYKKSFKFKNALLRKNQLESWAVAHKKLLEFYNSSITLTKS